MRLTCPHCQKAHHLKPDKIPAGAKHARCQACGDLIPLPDQQDADTDSAVHYMDLSCIYCGAKFSTPHSEAESVPCSACGRPIVLVQHPPDKGNGTPPKKSKVQDSKPANNPEAPPRPTPKDADHMQVSCRSCNQKYKIRKSGIPENARALKCKSCGQKIPIRPAAPKVTIVETDREDVTRSKSLNIPQSSLPRNRLDLMTEEKRQVYAAKGKRKWVVGAIIVFLAAVVLTFSIFNIS
jgi:predicted Zn finger-like uncharacterized protein